MLFSLNNVFIDRVGLILQMREAGRIPISNQGLEEGEDPTQFLLFPNTMMVVPLLAEVKLLHSL